MAQATGGGQLQFVKQGAAPARPLVGHVDVFLDVMRMDHDVDVRGRLTLDDYAISPVDTLIAKAQIGVINQKDVHDIIALLKDLPLRETDDDLSICVPYLAETCAWDWGLYTDLTANLRIVLDWLGRLRPDGAGAVARLRACHRGARGHRGRGEAAELAPACPRGQTRGVAARGGVPGGDARRHGAGVSTGASAQGEKTSPMAALLR